MTRAAIYARLSMDRKLDGDNVDRQIRLCHKLAAAHGWDVVEVFSDNNRSAWQENRYRPGFNAMLQARRNGEFDAIVSVSSSRVSRRMEDLLKVASIPGAEPLKLLTPEDLLDLGKPSHMYRAQGEAAANQRDSGVKSEATKVAMADNAEQGKWHGPTPYGYRSSDEADVVRGIIADLLGGVSLRTITQALNDAQVAAPRGGAWKPGQVRQVALRPINCGQRVHNGTTYDVKNMGDALVSVDIQAQVTRLLDDPERRSNAGTYRKHLLSGILECWKCDGPMYHVAPGYYRCFEGRHVSVKEEWVDAWVLQCAQWEITHGQITADSGDDQTQALAARMDGLEARRREISQALARGEISIVLAGQAEALIDAEVSEVKELQRQADEVRRVDRSIVIADLSPERQRVIIRTLFARIVINPKPRPDEAWEDRILIFNAEREQNSEPYRLRVPTAAQRAKITAAARA